MLTDTAAVAGSNDRAYAHYLERVDVLLDDVMFRIWVDYEPADASVGVNATAWLVHAHVGDSPTDIACHLKETTVNRLEAEAAEYLSGGGRHDFD
jgi:hypothetical protein